MSFNPDKPFDLGLSDSTPVAQVPQAKSVIIEETKVEVSIQPKKEIHFKLMHPDKFIVTQSDMKKLIQFGEEVPHCALQFMETIIFKNFKWPESLSMLSGSYFETLCLGSGAGGKKVLDLPRKTLSEKKYKEMIAAGIPEADIKGEKTIDQVRIEQQALRFPQRMAELKIAINEYNTQVPILKHLWANVFLAGELDIWPTVMLTPEGLRWVILDLKLTADVYSTWGDFAWGAPETMDHTQGRCYLELIENINFELNPHLKDLHDTMPKVFEKANNGDFAFYYWIWGYKKEQLHLQEKNNIRVHYGQMERKELMESIRKYVAIVEHYMNMDTIPTHPCFDFCNKCPVSSLNGGYCTDMSLTQVV